MRTTKHSHSLISIFVTHSINNWNPIDSIHQNFKTLPSCWSWAGWFESYLVSNPKTGFLITGRIIHSWRKSINLFQMDQAERLPEQPHRWDPGAHPHRLQYQQLLPGAGQWETHHPRSTLSAWDPCTLHAINTGTGRPSRKDHLPQWTG